jgi:hypothetical protein
MPNLLCALLMVWAVITINCLLSLGLVWLAWQMWLLRRAFVATVRAVDGWTLACQNGLAPAPSAIMQVQRSAHAATATYRATAQKLQKIYSLLLTVQRVYVRLQPRGKRGKR